MSMCKLPIYVDSCGFGPMKNVSSVKTQYPCFILKASNWDDYCYCTTFKLWYCVSERDKHEIGDVKIGTIKNIEPYNPGHSYNQLWVVSVMDDCYFDGLPDEFFTLGQSLDYYNNIKRYFYTDYSAIFSQFRDCAICTAIADKFEQENIFRTSLERYPDAGLCLLEARYRLEGKNPNGFYNFSFAFEPDKNNLENKCEIKFEFDGNSNFSRRCYALIGENGVGKTTLLSQLPIAIKNAQGHKGSDRFDQIPIFNKIIAVSHSYYDDFECPEQTDSFNYVYCGLMDVDANGKKVLSSRESIEKKILDSFEVVFDRGRIDIWAEYVELFFSRKFFDDTGFRLKKAYYLDALKNELKKSSSGQNAIIFELTSIIANIRSGSLLCIDEPEIHLHPRAISLLVKIIHKIVDRFRSYCIIATHSPIVVREMKSESVYVMDRIGNMPIIRSLEIETLGENLSILMNEIFDIIDIEPYFKEQIRKLREDKKKDEVVDMVQGNSRIPLNFNLRMFISGLYKEDAETEKN